MVDNIFLNFWELLGLSPEETKICQSLTLGGELTVLALSRLARQPRTTVYRNLEKLESEGIINILIDSYTTKAKLSSPEKIEQIVNRKINQNNQLQQLLPQVKNQLYALDHLSQGQTQVLFFRGQESVTRMAWGLLQAKNIVRAYSSRQFAELTGLKEAKNYKIAWEESGLKARDLISDSYLQSQKELPELNTGQWTNWTTKYIPKTVLNVEQTLDIYDDTIAVYNWVGGEIFGLQIINPTLANFHKQLFDIIWNTAKTI